LIRHFALLYRQLYPGHVHVVRIEDVMADPGGTRGPVCEALGLERAETLRGPSWNGAPLDEVYPWGTIRKADPAANRATALELTDAERSEVRARAWPYLDTFDYGSVVD